MNSLNSEEQKLKALAVPGDVAGTVTGARVNIGKGEQVAVELNSDAAAQDLVVALKQHTAAAGGTTANLQYSGSYFFHPADGSASTKVDFVDQHTLTISEINGAAGVIELDILADKLDVNNGYGFVSANLSAGGAKVVSGVYKLIDAKNKPAYYESI